MPTMSPPPAAARSPSAPGTTPPPLFDPSQYVCRPGVPILPAHTFTPKPRTVNRNGVNVLEERPPVEVDEARLMMIARNAQSRQALGDYPPLFLGHIDRTKSEIEQPPLAGYATNVAMGVYDGAPCLYGDLYVKAGMADLAEDFPRRSVEAMYDLDDDDGNFIDNIALLKRMPYFAMGLVAKYQAGPTAVRACYEMDDDRANPPPTKEAPSMPVPDPNAAPAAPPAPIVAQAADPNAVATAPPAAPDNSGVLSPDATAALIQAVVTAVMAAMKPAEPPPAAAEAAPAAVAEQAEQDDDENVEQADGDPGEASGSNTFIPGEVVEERKPKDDEDDTRSRAQMSRDSAAIADNRTVAQYAADLASSRAEVATLRAENTTLKGRSLRAGRERDLIQLEAEGFQFSRADELEDVVGLNPEQYGRHLARIRKCYKQDNSNLGLLETAAPIHAEDSVPSEPAGSGDPAKMTKADGPLMAAYCAENKLTNLPAVEQVKRYKAHKVAQATGARQPVAR